MSFVIAKNTEKLFLITGMNFPNSSLFSSFVCHLVVFFTLEMWTNW